MNNPESSNIEIGDSATKAVAEATARAVQDVVIVGNGLTAWTVAAVLASQFRCLNIRILNWGKGDNLLPVESAWPSVRELLHSLNVSEQQLIAEAIASYNLGTCYQNWPPHHNDFFQPFSDIGFRLKGVDFFQYLMRARAEKLNVALTPNAYSLAAMAAQKGKFRLPSDNPSSVFSTLQYGLNLDTCALQRLFESLAKQRGVSEEKLEHFTVNLHPSGKDIESIESVAQQTGDVEQVRADLFIDCTGASGALIKHLGKAQCHGDALHVAFCAEQREAVAPYSTLTAVNSGWSSVAQSEKFIAGVYVVETPKTQTENNAADRANIEEKLNASFGKSLLNVELIESAKITRNKWQGNCLAIGDSAGYVEPLFISKLHVIHRSMLRLVELFPANTQAIEACARQYNHISAQEQQHTEAFNRLHRASIEGCLHSQIAQSISQGGADDDRLQYRLSLFKDSGRYAFFEHDVIPPHCWQGFLINNQVWPDRYDPRVDAVDNQWLIHQLNKIHTTFVQASNAMPQHHEFIVSQRARKPHARN